MQDTPRLGGPGTGCADGPCPPCPPLARTCRALLPVCLTVTHLEAGGVLKGPRCPVAMTMHSTPSTEPCGTDSPGCRAQVKTHNPQSWLLPSSCFSPSHVLIVDSYYCGRLKGNGLFLLCQEKAGRDNGSLPRQ